MKYRCLMLLLVAVIMLSGCAAKSSAPPDGQARINGNQPTGTEPVGPADHQENTAETISAPTETEQAEASGAGMEKKQPEVETDPVQAVLSRMSLEEKIYQLFFITPEQLTGEKPVTVAGQTTKDCIEKYPVGGIIYFPQNIISGEQIRSMIDNTQSFSKIAVFTGIDEEGGTVSRVSSKLSTEITVFPSMYTIGKTGNVAKAYEVGFTIGSECTQLGFNLDFAPVADVYSNRNNTVIGHRAFSSDATVAAAMVEACVQGFRDAGMLCTLKHFPGHGNTLADSHFGAAATDKTLGELQGEEFLPFESGIRAGAEFVMVGHILTPNITDASTPATLSPDMLAILRNDLQFDGIIITDAMNMAAIADYYTSAEAAVKAIQAGVDMILMPADFHAAYEGVLTAVQNGELTESRIDESVTRILQAKIDSGLLDTDTTG